MLCHHDSVLYAGVQIFRKGAGESKLKISVSI